MAATILVVNDDQNSITLYQIILQRAGYQTLQAKDGLEAFEIAKAQLPDLIVSDTVMPRVEGRELLQMLRKEPMTSHIPFILVTVTGLGTFETDEWVEDLLLFAPIDVAQLGKHVQKLLAAKGIG